MIGICREALKPKFDTQPGGTGILDRRDPEKRPSNFGPLRVLLHE